MPDLAKMRDEHAELGRIMRRLASLIARPTPPPQLKLFEVRRELASTLIGHLKSEDWLLYPRLAASPDSRISSAALALSDEMGGLAEAFVSYCDRWSASAIAADWAPYCSDSRSLIAVLTERITRENQELYPLFESLKRAA